MTRGGRDDGGRDRATTRVAPTPLLPVFREMAGCPKETWDWIPASAGMTRAGRDEGWVSRRAGGAGMTREARNGGWVDRRAGRAW